MELTEIKYEVSEHIATITFNRPEALNAWTQGMDVQYREAMSAAEADDDVRVIIVTGAGKGFCAGADMSLLSDVSVGDVDISSARDSDVPASQGNGSGEDFTKKYSFPPSVHKPIIAAINGAAVGLGFVHALYCDIRFASDTAKMAVIFPQRGLIAEYGLAWMLPRLIGMNNAMDLMLSGRVIKGAEAQEMGLVGRVYPADELMERVREYAVQMATFSSPRSTRVIKRQAYDALFTDLGTAIDVAVDEMYESLACDDFREGVASFLEKRAPEFTGK